MVLSVLLMAELVGFQLYLKFDPVFLSFSPETHLEKQTPMLLRDLQVPALCKQASLFPMICNLFYFGSRKHLSIMNIILRFFCPTY